MKKNKKNKKETPEAAAAALGLPQNIMPVGERVLENKNIYIHQRVYAFIHKFAENKTENEHGGILVGRVVNEMGKENTIIEGFIEAKYNNATQTTLTFTHDTWEYFHKEMDKKYKGKKIVGWIHTHPDFGIFLSENDRFIHENFFSDANQVAYVVDPVKKEEGFFFWVDGKLERCPGFYLYDKNEAKLKVKKLSEFQEEKSGKSDKTSVLSFVTFMLMIIILIFNILFMLMQNDRIANLEKEINLLKNNQIRQEIRLNGIAEAEKTENNGDENR